MKPLNHAELQEMLPAAALEILDGTDLQLVMAHARACSECTGLLREYRDTAASLTLTLPRQELDPSRSAAIRDRLLARAGADQDPRVADSSTDTGGPSRARRLFQVDRWSGWLVAAGLAGVLLMHHAVHRPLNYGWLAAGALAILLVAVGWYARVQRSRAAALRDRLAKRPPG